MLIKIENQINTLLQVATFILQPRAEQNATFDFSLNFLKEFECLFNLLFKKSNFLRFFFFFLKSCILFGARSQLECRDLYEPIFE